MATLFGLAWLGVVIFRLVGPLNYEPVILEGLAPAHQERAAMVNVYDGRRVEQTFWLPATVVSHVGVHVLNDRGADPNAVVTVQWQALRSDKNVSAHVRVADLRPDDVTLIPFNRRLPASAEYRLTLRTSGVTASEALSIAYESESGAFSSGSAQVVVERKPDSETRPLTGNIKFQVLTIPTKSLIWKLLWNDPLWWAGLGYFACLILLYGVRDQLARILPLASVTWRVSRISVREIVLAGAVGTVMAMAVTLPYFTQLSRITTAGDVQRALVYRGVARESWLQGEGVATWDPYLCGGEPLLANMESAHLDPFFLLVLAFGENFGARLSVALTLILGFVGTYVLARRYMRVSSVAALLAGALFSFSGFPMLAFANGNYAWIPVGWIPWALLFFLGSLSVKPARHIVLTALVLAFIFLGGSLHMVVYALLVLALVAMFLCLFYKTIRPLAVLGLILMLFTSLIAVKLWPVAEIEAVSGQFIRPEPFIQPWSWLPRMFWQRDQLSTPAWTFAKTGENYRWIEYGAYVGVMPVIFFLLGAASARGRKLLLAMVGASLIMLLMTFNEFPVTILRELPFGQGVFRNPQRIRVVFLLLFGIIASYGLDWFVRHRWVRVGLVVLILVDLATFHSRLYPGLFNLPRPNIEVSDQFTRLHESYTDFEANGYYKVSYENYRAHTGVVDICMPYMMQRGVHARGLGSSNPDKPYFGEAMLVNEGRVDQVTVNGDVTAVSFKTEKDGWLVLNQNFFPGWQTRPPREVRNRDGLVAARIRADDTYVQFIYDPLAYRLGRWVTLAGLVLCILPFSRRVRKSMMESIHA